MKSFVSMCIFLIIYSHSYAQKKENFQFGIKGGINYAELLGRDALPDKDRKVGYSFGLYTNHKLSEHFKLQPEIIWSLQGDEIENKGRYNISYINIPIMLKWHKGKFYTETGPQLGILTINTSNTMPDNLRLENFDTFDFLLNAGVGYEISEDWTLGIRYTHGLTNLVKGLNLKNSVFYIGFAYNIH
ncbi:porin family protein [Algoriphagus sp. NG3]|uniref:porin family protein n=1 Tax=Algoriphagus sp. NG3 TaxID=3097546 RepID=UPI002A8325BA|nr:porin family protein [Algoriphagus sp. NG3]WPR77630.1 porin family protein [Algoriphagus sp. NG3]